MGVFNLDENEEIDHIKINGTDYEVGDIPIRIIDKIMKIKTGFFQKDPLDQWKPICHEILSIRNQNIDLSNLTREKLFAFITYVKGKIEKGQIG